MFRIFTQLKACGRHLVDWSKRSNQNSKTRILQLQLQIQKEKSSLSQIDWDTVKFEKGD